jgi:aquaporin NIP
MQSILLESVLTFFLMFVIAAVATDGRAVGDMAGWAIGGTVALASIFGGPVSGASMNPARSLGPALIAGQMDQVWIYIVGPLAGAIAGACVYQVLRCGGDEKTADGCC